jgi:hypothetical protein
VLAVCVSNPQNVRRCVHDRWWQLTTPAALRSRLTATDKTVTNIGIRFHFQSTTPVWFQKVTKYQ